MNISVLIPTRDRQSLLKQTVDVLLANAQLDTTRVVVGFDDDEAIDPEAFKILENQRVRFSVAKREDTLGAKYNRLIEAQEHKADIYLIWADDMTVVTPGWDRQLAEAAALFTDGIGLVFFGKLHGVLQPGIAVTHRLVELMGELCDPSYAFWWQDTRLIEIGRMTSRIVEIAGIDVKLLDELKGKSRGVRDLAWWGQFYDATRPQRIAIAQRIIEQCNEQPYRKKQLHALLPNWAKIFTEWNKLCSEPASAKQLEAHYAFDAPADERYLRVRARAEETLAATQKAIAA